MSFMSDKPFIDTNIFVYAAIEDNVSSKKHRQSLELIVNADTSLVTSIQVVNEFYSVLLKQKIEEDKIREKASEILEEFEIVSITPSIIRSAWKLRDKYQCSYWDSLIVSSALHAECNILYTEDLQHGQIIAKKLRIINPFEK